MLIPTHLRIGKAILTTIETEVPFKINHNAFQYGCILPDILMVDPNHTKNASLSFLSDFMQRLVRSESLKDNPREKHNLSIKLGIISHFVCDYFCQPHNNDPMYSRLIPHIQYENRLHTECNSFNLASICRSGLKNFLPPMKSTPIFLIDYIQINHLAYLSEKPAMGKDINYAVKIANNVITAILVNFAAKNKEWVA